MKQFFLFSTLILILGVSCRKVKPLKDEIDFPVAYIVNGESNSLSIINLDTEEQVEVVEFNKGTWPHHINTNSTKDKLVISLVGTDLSGGHAGHNTGTESYLIVLQSSNLKVLAFTKTEYVGHNAIFMNNDEEIWLPQMTDDGVVLKLNSANLKEIGSIAVGAGPLEITKDVNGVYAFVCNGEGNSVSIINSSTSELVKTITVGTEPVGAWPASNNKMYVDCEVSKEIYEIDAASLEITDTIDLNYTPAYVAYNSVTSELWVTDAQNGGIHHYELIAGEWSEISFLATGSGAHAVTFNASQTKAFVTNQTANTVSIIEATTFLKLKDVAVQNKPNGILILE